MREMRRLFVTIWAGETLIRRERLDDILMVIGRRFRQRRGVAGRKVIVVVMLVIVVVMLVIVVVMLVMVSKGGCDICLSAFKNRQ